MSSVYQFQVSDINGQAIALESYRGQVLLIVNTASRCGFTPQYQELETLYRDFKDRGFAVLAFPCNQFGSQEPGNSREIAEFCSLNYQVSFPLFEKIDVNGDNAHSLYRHLKASAPGVLGSEAVKWNFTKFLIDREGRVVERYAPITAPAAIRADIERLLAD